MLSFATPSSCLLVILTLLLRGCKVLGILLGPPKVPEKEFVKELRGFKKVLRGIVWLIDHIDVVSALSWSDF